MQQELSSLPRSRAEALKTGANEYFTGRCCKKGHLSARRVSNALCIACQAEYSKTWAKLNPTKVRSSNKNWAAKNPGKGALYTKRYREANRGIVLKKARDAYYRDVDHHRQRAIDWHKNNRQKSSAISSRRRAAQLQAMPPWHDEWDDFVWREAHELRRLRNLVTGVMWQCDHMIPLLAKNARGLHVAENFQVIPAKLNWRKKNKMVFTEPGQWISAL